jgi:hypothetical protein
MHSVDIPEAKITRYIPKDLSECDAQQYMDMCELIFYFQNQQIDYDEFRTHAIYKLMNMKPTKKVSDEEESKFSNIYQLSELIDSFFELNEDGQRTIKQYYIDNPVPKIKILFKTFYGPEDGFNNMTFGEYRDALRFFHDFHATGDMEYLKLLTAVFYRPKKWFKKMPYNTKDLDKRIAQYKYAPIGFVYGVYLLFASFQKYLVDAKIMWSGKELDLSILFDSSTKSDEPDSAVMPGIGMDSVAFSMAESGVFGTLKEVDETDFWDIIVRMYDIRKTALEQEKQTNNATNK